MVIDVSAILAVLLNEKSRPGIERATKGADLAAPGCLPWDVGNALYGAVKRERITTDQALQVFRDFRRIPVRVLEVDFEAAIDLAVRFRIPAYDAYYVQSAKSYGRPLLTLDERMENVAKSAGVQCLL